MGKKALKLGAASILALGAGAAVVSKKNKRDEQRQEPIPSAEKIFQISIT